MKSQDFSGTKAQLIGTNSYDSEASITRPADALPYAAGDVVADSDSVPTVLEFASIGPSGGRIEVTLATHRIDVAAVPSGMADFRLHLYDAEPTAIADKVAFNLPNGDRAKYLGHVDITTPLDLGDTLWGQADFSREFKLADGSTSLWGIVETIGAYTPSASDVHTIGLKAVRV